ncbi:hypothetical protein D3C73_1141020 [compost metagenome]
MTEVRDWQKDIKMMEGTFEFDWTNNQDLQIEMGEALPYWLQQYAEWKAEAAKAEVKAAVEKVRADKAESRENHLRTLLESERTKASGTIKMIDHLFEHLYPSDKEEEAK